MNKTPLQSKVTILNLYCIETENKAIRKIENNYQLYQSLPNIYLGSAKCEEINKFWITYNPNNDTKNKNSIDENCIYKQMAGFNRLFYKLIDLFY